MLPATLTVAPIHPLRLSSRNKADSAAQAATLKLVGRATHNVILFASPRVSRSSALSLPRFALVVSSSAKLMAGLQRFPTRPHSEGPSFGFSALADPSYGSPRLAYGSPRLVAVEGFMRRDV